MATEALADVAQLKKKTLATEYAGLQSNQFIDDMKASTMFQFNWGELLAAAPTALSLMGSCWVAASSPIADQIVMTKAVPTGGFKWIPNRSEPTLRTILVTVCNDGSKDAFALAGRNMEGLRIRAHRVCNDDIPMVFKRLPPCTKGPDELQNFNDALDDFASDARQAARLATETREAFTKWGKMVGELHAATEQQKGQTAIERDDARVAENVAKIEEKFAVDAEAATKENVAYMKEQVKKTEKRLDTALDKVPGPWETVIQGAITGYTQALPSIIGGVLPMVLAASNPLGAVAMAASGAAGAGAKQANGGTVNGTTAPANVVAAAEQGAAVAQKASDPAYAAAGELRDLVTHFYEFLGGEKGAIDWTKFKESTDDVSTTTPSGTSYLLATLNGRKRQIDATGTAPSKKLIGTIDGLIKVTDEISTALKDEKDMKADKVPEAKTTAWKTTVKKGKADILQLASSAPAQGGSNVPNPFGNVKIDIPKTDLSAQNAQLSSAMQGVQIAQNASDLAQNSYDASVKKQAETAKAMAEVEKRLKSVQGKGQTLDEIKKVLKDCVAVLVDLVIQIGKIEKFFTMLTTVIDHIVLPQAERFTRDMGRAAERSARDKFINVDDVAKQTTYASTLQLKAYFSLLEDVASMYSQVDRQYISPGVAMCDQLSAGSSSKIPMEQLSQQLSKYNHDSAKAVADLVSSRQQEILKGLRERAKKAAKSSEAIENTIRAKGLTVDDSSKAAIEKGAEQAKAETKTLVEGNTSQTAIENENQDLNAI